MKKKLKVKKSYNVRIYEMEDGSMEIGHSMYFKEDKRSKTIYGSWTSNSVMSIYRLLAKNRDIINKNKNIPDKNIDK
jgi:hypothetical protein